MIFGELPYKCTILSKKSHKLRNVIILLLIETWVRNPIKLKCYESVIGRDCEQARRQATVVRRGARSSMSWKALWGIDCTHLGKVSRWLFWSQIGDWVSRILRAYQREALDPTVVHQQANIQETLPEKLALSENRKEQTSR